MIDFYTALQTAETELQLYIKIPENGKLGIGSDNLRSIMSLKSANIRKSEKIRNHISENPDNGNLMVRLEYQKHQNSEV